MTDSELEDRLFTYLWLSLHTPKAHAGRVAQLFGGSGAWPGWDGRRNPCEGRGEPGRPARCPHTLELLNGLIRSKNHVAGRRYKNARAAGFAPYTTIDAISLGPYVITGIKLVGINHQFAVKQM